MTASTFRLGIAHDGAHWSRACEASGQKITAFHTWTWLRAAAPLLAGTFVPYVVRRGSVDVGVLPILVRRRGLLATIDCVPFPYCGPLVPADALPDCLALLRREATRRLTVRTTIQFPPGATVDAELLRSHQFTPRGDVTYVIDTSVSEERLWAGLTSECRRRVRMTERSGLRIDLEPDPRLLDDFHRYTFADRGGRSGYVADLSRALARLAGPDLRLRCVSAVRDGEPLGVLVTLATDTAALGWMGGVFPQHRATHAGHLLYWDAIRWAATTGCRTLDMVGVPNEGIARFKRQFGGSLESYVVGERDAPAAKPFLARRRGASRPTGPDRA